METLSSSSAVVTEASLAGNAPHTPPYTPHRAKHTFKRNDSPASARSVKTTETNSPAKQNTNQVAEDEVQVEELIEGDVGYMTDIDVVYPHELEEVESASDHESNGLDDDGESGDEISKRLSRLGCEDSPEQAEFEMNRRAARMRKRRDSRVFKRSHSQSIKSDTDVTDPDAMADHDVSASARRLRRRVRGPAEADADMDNVMSSPTPAYTVTSSPDVQSGPCVVDDSERNGRYQHDYNAMELDDL